ncbi:MAG: bifunctional DNA-formamidopyrimidine glycosylase/DNA-(apurinic or apyrimidinic site) lyase [Dehalococcoidales bacterium]|nr:bifunctional DNA-formamidopyrimidine glycosylase/DNA-(apurinic or apyrimidinic site) lyase [Dehalococcoidales bacterium]
MPELPEVETVKNELAPHIVGRTVKKVNLIWEGIVRKPAAAEFSSRLKGRKITGLGRRGKYLLAGLDNGEWLILHMKMSGSLLVRSASSAPPRFTRAVLHLDDGSGIFFCDPRKFGRMWLVEDKESVIGELGPEPLEPAFTPAVLTQVLHKRKAPLKAVLCDQHVIAGIGNLYADEALYLAKIHPLRLAGSLTPVELKRLHRAILEVLLKGIKNKGASIENYVRPDGTPGSAHLEFMVPRKAGEPCIRCGTPVVRITVRGRGTYFCPKCQVGE